MKYFYTLLSCLLSIAATAQNPEIIGGFLLDGKDSLEELDAAVLVESKRKEKELTGKGMIIPGACICMTPENIGEEIGSLINIKDSILVRSISFTVKENRMEGCKASIRIYSMDGKSNLMNIFTIPIEQDIPKAEKKKTFSIAPEDILILEPGDYYISLSITELSEDIMERWADSDTWNEDEHYTKYMQDRIYFPVYVKNSFHRDGAKMSLKEWWANIGLSVKGWIIG